MSRTLAAALAATLLAAAVPALAQPPAAAPAPQTKSLQGDPSAWINDPHMHAFYDLTVQAFAAGPAKVDEAAYQKKAYELFAAFGAAHGMKPEAMVDHLKLIPGQVVQIVREDPTVLASYKNFVDATFGPQ
jgi:hypothetical protein